jgi:hypothetical protein
MRNFGAKVLSRNVASRCRQHAIDLSSYLLNQERDLVIGIAPSISVFFFFLALCNSVVLLLFLKLTILFVKA